MGRRRAARPAGWLDDLAPDAPPPTHLASSLVDDDALVPVDPVDYLTAAEYRAARLAVCDRARDVADARFLLAALGLNKDTEGPSH